MSQTVIKLNGVSKMYRLGAGPQGRGDFRDTLRSTAGRLLRRGHSGRTPDQSRNLDALKDISFSVNRGEAVGIVGHNGAGKSTLLKILSRITDPTEGEAWYQGRLGSLLEVGTGFHPELSGRENIYLNGTILGMTRSEITAKFEEIVEFSEIGRFLDTPVKRYSSGMYVRLAFSVAAHLEPEIIIVDEVLAVGDARFQRKCVEKMQSIVRDGRTILFVSHNMSSVEELCDRAIVLSAGRMIADGQPDEVIRTYLQSLRTQVDTPIVERTDRTGAGKVKVTDLHSYIPGHEDADGCLVYGKPAHFRVDIDKFIPDMACTIGIYNDRASELCRLQSANRSSEDESRPGTSFVLELPELLLMPGDYVVNVSILAGQKMQDMLRPAGKFSVSAGTLRGRPLTPQQSATTFCQSHRWITPG